MRVEPRRTLSTLLLIGTLIALLSVLAYLQYRWLGQISVAERQTMQTNLRSQGRGLQEEINKEIINAGSRIRMSLDEYHNKKWDELIERYSRWKQTATYPGLIKTLFIAQLREGHFDLIRLNEAAKRFEPAEWPENFTDIRKRFTPLQRAYANVNERREMEHKEEERSIGSLIEHGYVSEEGAALAQFLVEFQKMEEPKDNAERERIRMNMIAMLQESPLALIALDMDYIRQTFLPALFKQRFTVDGALDYEMNVVFRKGAEVKRERFIGALDETQPGAGDLALNMFVGPSSAELTRGSRWQIVINHRAGSLDAAVTQARNRNLIVSFGILSLLAISTIIIIVISRRAQSLARKQMDFVAGVSHEFRTPLTVIHAVSENLADGLITDQQQIEQCGVVIRNDVRRLSGMVEQVLEFAGASRGKNLYQPYPVNLEEVIDQALAENPSLEPNLNWRIEKEIEPHLPPVMADPAALTSAVRNIIDNAVKYGGDAHWIAVKARVNSANDNPHVEVTVADRGVGIPESDLPHIFEPFYRGREVVAAQVHGNGLGLSLVKNIVDAHGGTIKVSSSSGKGSVFTLSLPAANGAWPKVN
jgi:signal transduction histidine kinase